MCKGSISEINCYTFVQEEALIEGNLISAKTNEQHVTKANISLEKHKDSIWRNIPLLSDVAVVFWVSLKSFVVRPSQIKDHSRKTTGPTYLLRNQNDCPEAEVTNSLIDDRVVTRHIAYTSLWWNSWWNCEENVLTLKSDCVQKRWGVPRNSLYPAHAHL